MICKYCGHPVTMAGGEYYHTENEFSNICKVCGCKSPESNDMEEGYGQQVDE